MKMSIPLIALILLTLSACTGHRRSEGSTPLPVQSRIIEEFMIPDLVIGGEDLPAEYRILYGGSVCANAEGDILVDFQNQIMVFDRNGRPKKVIGKPGTGLGEFEGIHTVTLSETGFMTVIGGPYSYTYLPIGPLSSRAIDCIRDGYAYVSTKWWERARIPPRIVRYRINPAIYEK